MEHGFARPEWLERVNRLALISRLLSSTVHDVSNALQVISGSAEVLLLSPSAAQAVTRRSEAIGSHARRATDILAHVTAFAGDANDRIDSVDLKSASARALAMRQYALRRMRIAASVDGNEVMVQANPRRLTQIVLNLIVNVEHALVDRESGRLTLVVSTHDGYGELRVGDDGPGMPERAAQTALPIDDASGDRLGIGLAVSEWLAAEQRGRLGYAPGATGGTLVTLALPLSGR